METKNIILKILLFLGIFFFAPVEAAASQPFHLFINEFMADNDHMIADEAGEYDDWIEIYNGENFDIDLNGYYLTDDLADPMQWAFPDVTIPSKGYLLIWADNNLEQPGLHANFKLNKDGEQIGLYNSLAYVDSFTFVAQSTDISHGRETDGSEYWVFFNVNHNPPTPGTPNFYTYEETPDPPNFSPDEGFYPGSISVELSTNEPEAVIYYTLDGSIPTSSSMQYASPINITASTTIRAISHKEITGSGDLISDVVSKCYILNIQHTMPLINVVCDPVEFDEIYNPKFYQPGKPHPSILAYFKYFDGNNILQGDLPISFSLHGGYSVVSPKKSLTIVFTDQNFQYNLFDQEYVYPRPSNLPSSFKSFNLIGMAADYSLIRNYLSMQLLRNAGLNYPQVAFIRLLINGNDRGIYVPIERIDEKYVKDHGFESGNYDIIKTGCEHECDLTLKNLNGQYFEIKAGDFVAFDEFLEWLYRYGHNYDELINRIDLQSFLFYDMMCRFSNNRDSYDINYYLIKNRDVQNSKWIIFLWDTDESFGWDRNFDGRWFRHNFLFDQLWQNERYVNLFYNTLADLLNTKWSYNEIDKLIQKMENLFQIDDPADETIWNSVWYNYAAVTIPDLREDPQYNPLSRYRHLNCLREWVQNRIDFVFERFRWSEGEAKLIINPPTGGNGAIQLNSLRLTNYPWTGTYFREIPIPLTAIPDPGYLFVGWSDPSVPQTEQINITLYNDYTINVIFEADTSVGEVVINEINYNSAESLDPEDWIEIYNPSAVKLDVSGWHLKDEDNAHDFIFPEGTIISAQGYLVLCRDQTRFHAPFPDVMNYIGNFDFGLSASGDQVRIFNSSRLLIDSVQYDDAAPWPTEPDGNGPTLELIDPELDNALPESWQASQNHGTPGHSNSKLFSITGEVVYYSNSIAIPQALMSLIGATTKSTANDTCGCFCLNALVSGDYKLRAIKENDISSSISALDAAWILQYSVSLNTFTPYQMIAGDVTGDGEITTYDAAYILQYIVGQINKFPIMTDSTHFWKFVPDDFPLDSTNWIIAPDSIYYTPLSSDTTGNYKGIIYGDVTGNWSPGGGNLTRVIVAEANIRLDNIYEKSGNKISLPLYMDGRSGIIAMSFVLAYDPQFLKAIGASVIPLTQDYLIATNIEKGQIKVALAGSQPINESGAVVNLEFEVLKTEPPDANCQLQITELLVNDVQIRANIQPVEFRVKSSIPTEYALHYNYPNPFNSETLIKYQIPQPGKVILNIYNPLGQEIRSLIDRENMAGYHEVIWDGKNNQGQPAPSGLYFYRIQAAEFQAVKKLLLIK